jgi:hypothetical protein
MKQEIIGGKVYFYEFGEYDGYLGNLERRKISKFWKKAGITRKKIWEKGRHKGTLSYYETLELNRIENELSDLEKKKGLIKKIGKAVKKGAKAVGKVAKKVGKPLALATGVYFGTPLFVTKVLPALGGAGKTLLSKVDKTKTGSWWAKQGKKIFRVAKTPSKKIITQEVKPENPVYEELISKVSDGVFKNSDIMAKLEQKIPFPLPSGLPTEDVKTIQENIPEAEPLPDEYKPDEQVEVTAEGEVKRTEPVGVGTLIPLAIGGGLLLL